MAQAQLQEELIPAGGIADFVMSDAEIAALESEEATEQFGDSGIARFEPIAKRMASYGRYGDDQVIHAETGELLVPRALIEGNPELKESIFSHLREMGIEDPDRYVVGSSANSINPDTGMPEFFFKSIRRAVSKVAKGVSKAVSKVGKVLKKVAPVVLPIVLTPILGPVYAGAVGSGIASLLNGGSLKDAVKAAALGGVTGAVFAGATGKGSFFDNIKAATADAGGRFSQLGSAIGKSASTGSFDPLMQSYQPAGTTEGLDQTFAEVETGVRGGDTVTPAETVAEATDISKARARLDYANQAVTPPDGANVVTIDQTGKVVPTATSDYSVGMSSPVTGPDISAVDLDAANVQLNQMPTTGPGAPPPPPPAETSFFDTAKGYASDAGDYLFRGGQTEQQVKALKDAAYKDVLARTGDKTLAQQAFNAAGPGYIARFGPSIALAGVGAAAGGFFDAAPQEDPNLVDRRTGADLLAENEDQYMVGGRAPQYATGPTTVKTQYGYDPRRAPVFMSSPFVRPQTPTVYGDARDYRVFMGPQMYAAAGGEVYPRRNGGIMPNEGVPNQDSVRALLMPGEFVMTKDAVRGLGGGNLNQGINNMYSMMRNLETRGQVA